MKTKSKMLLLLAVCALCVSVMAAGFAMTNRKTARAEDAAITGATLTLGNCIAIRYYANASESGALTMRFTMNGAESDVVKAQVDGENQVYFDFEVAPQCIGDEVTAELYSGESKLAEQTYSVEQYCKGRIADETSDADLKTLCADILAYGAAAQTYKGYKTDSLVNAENAGVPTDFEQIEETDLSVTGAIDENTAFTGANCYFDGKNEIYFIYKTDDVSAITYAAKKDGKTVGYRLKESGAGKYAVVIDVYAVDFDAVYTVSLTKGENTQTATYSLKSYVYYWQNKTEEGSETLLPMATLARALWNYGKASEAWYYMPVISFTDENVTVKAGETYIIPQATATNRAGEALKTTVYVNGEETEAVSAVFYENGTITYSADSHGNVAVFNVNVNVDYDGVNLADAHYLDTAADRFYGIYGATFYYNVGGTQSIGRFTGKQIYDERVDVGMSVNSFVGSMAFNLRGGSETEKGLWIKIENSGGGRIQIYNGSQKLTDTDDTMPDTKGNTDYWNNILQKSFNFSVQVTDKKNASGEVTAVIVNAAIGDLSVTGENGFEIAVTDDNRATLTSKGWFFIEGGANTEWMKANIYVHSIYLNTPNYSSNLLLSGWNTKNSDGIITGVTNENGMRFATVTADDGSNKNICADWNRSYTDYGTNGSKAGDTYYGEKVKDQKVKITAKAAFKSGDDFCVYFRGNNWLENNWRWMRRGLFVSFSADGGIRICLGEAAFSYGNETKVYTTYSNEEIKATCGKTLSELFAEGITLEMQATDVTDGDGNVVAVNIRIWVNGVAINGGGYNATKLDYDAEGVTGDCIFEAGYLMLGGAITDTEGYIGGVYIEG